LEYLPPEVGHQVEISELSPIHRSTEFGLFTVIPTPFLTYRFADQIQETTINDNHALSAHDQHNPPTITWRSGQLRNRSATAPPLLVAHRSCSPNPNWMKAKPTKIVILEKTFVCPICFEEYTVLNCFLLYSSLPTSVLQGGSTNSFFCPYLSVYENISPLQLMRGKYWRFSVWIPIAKLN